MTTRLKGLTVAFTHDIREDDAGAVIAAIKMIKGVLDVQPSESTSSDWIAERRAQNDIGKCSVQGGCCTACLRESGFCMVDAPPGCGFGGEICHACP